MPISLGLSMPSFDDVSFILLLKIGRAALISQPLYSFVIRSECSLADVTIFSLHLFILQLLPIYSKNLVDYCCIFIAYLS